jgi:hypothetical protein
MNNISRLLARVLVAVIVVGSIAACVSQAARVPCDGRLEPINPPARKAEASGKKSTPATPRVSP